MPCEGRVWWPSAGQEERTHQNSTLWHPDHRLPASGTGRNKHLLLKPLVCGIVLGHPEHPEACSFAPSLLAGMPKQSCWSTRELADGEASSLSLKNQMLFCVCQVTPPNQFPLICNIFWDRIPIKTWTQGRLFLWFSNERKINYLPENSHPTN